MKLFRKTLLPALIIVAFAYSCGGGGGGSSTDLQTLHGMKIYCPDQLSECAVTNAGSDIYVGYKVNGTSGTCSTLLPQGQTAFDAFGTVTATAWNSGIEGIVSQFTNASGQPITTLDAAPNTSIVCCAVIDTQGAFGPDAGDPYTEEDCWPFHDVVDQNNMQIETAMPAP